ncbi:hypothetical protein CspHIS471_0207680 [Cutaneotrichosporon sp. HIS471]|nr:hypothetical protein CspHIS471_0207680 [Cutaneotrichosporon sp. HIS471]
MANLSLYTVTALLILDSEGNRVLAKYYAPPHSAIGTGTPAELGVGAGGPGMPGLQTYKEQRAFEKSVWEKTRRGAGEIHPLPPHLILSRPSTDLHFHISTLTAFHDAVSLLLRGQIEKRIVLESLDLVLLAADETVDDGIILETDAAAIAARVTRPKPDSTDIVINEQTLMNAYSTFKDRVTQRIGQL